MELDQVVDVTRTALIMVLKLSVPVLSIGLLVGLSVSLFQAVTQIQEQTLAFIPKIVAVVLALIVMLPMLLSWAVQYTRDTLGSLVGGG